MHTAAQLGRLRPTATFALVLSLTSLFSLAALGQEGAAPEKKTVAQQIEELVAKLETREAELEELSTKIERHPDRAAAALLEKEVSDRREKYRRDLATLVGLVLSGGDAGADVAQGRAAAVAILQDDAPKMKDKLGELDGKLVELVDMMASGTSEEAQKGRQEFVAQIPVSTRLLKYFQANIDLRKQLGVDVEADAAYLIKRLQTRADVGAGLLKSTKEQIDETATRPGVDQDGEAQKELAMLRKQRDALAESQRVTVDLMDQHGLETAGLRQGIISATGKLSQDILDKDVVSGLMESWLADSADWLRTNGAELMFQLVTFLLILFAFWIGARIGRSVVRRALDRSKLDISSLARDFFIKMTGRLIILFGIIVAIAQLGIEVGPLLAGLGIAGFVVGFALQDTLSNFASGLMILVYRPFDVGDVIEAGGVMGKVDQMNLVATMVLTFDNQLLVVPNKQIWGGVIRNVTHQDVRRVDMTFGIGYSDDIPKAEKVLAEIVTSHEKVLKDPEPVIRLHELGDSSVNFVVRPWSKTDEYWDVYWDVTREVKRRFDEEGISIPFPQRDVHIYREGDDEDA
jgi:small conductance mechanosensitive channel